MSINDLSVERELRYIIQWFNEWSELQRDDFLPILSEYLANGAGVYMNGVVSGMAAASCLDKPMSLFQCRVKLFREWSAKWPEDLKLKLKEKVLEIDPNFVERLNGELGGLSNGNGEVNVDEQRLNGIDGDGGPVPVELTVREQPQQLLVVSEG